MTLKDYFEGKKGTGVLATADSAGQVDAAVYSRPHFMEDGSLAFIMRDRLTHHNLQSNPYATFLFIENGPGYNGRRLFLKKLERRTTPSSSTRSSVANIPTKTKSPSFWFISN